MVFENGVKNIQAAAYNGARTVGTLYSVTTLDMSQQGVEFCKKKNSKKKFFY